MRGEKMPTDRQTDGFSSLYRLHQIYESVDPVKTCPLLNLASFKPSLALNKAQSLLKKVLI